MNCEEFQAGLQASFDGMPSPDAAALEQHRTSCPTCRALKAAAGRLREGLLLLPQPIVPAGLANQIVSRALAERRLLLRRRVVRFAALAASLLAATALLLAWMHRRGADGRHHPEMAELPRTLQPVPSLRDSVADAGSALMELTQRTADDTIWQTRNLVSGTLASAAFDENRVLKETIDPPARSLREAGQTVTMGLEPVAESARRAFDLFLNDLPPLSANKRGL